MYPINFTTCSVADLNAALKYPDATWAFFRQLDKAHCDLMDALLVRDGHPLASEPGTQEWRFRKLHGAGHQFTYLSLPTLEKQR